MIADGTIVNGDINASAAIADTKLATISTAGKVSNSATTATNLNTANAIVARDASGNFVAGTITAALNGNASTATSATSATTSTTAGALSSARTFALTGDVTGSVSSDLTSGASIATSIAAGSIVNADINASAAIADTKLATISTAGKVSNSATTATNANTANAIVARDASGNFSAGTITASLNGNASTATSATSATSATNATAASSLSALDDRTIAPSDIVASRAVFGFTSWANNNTSPYADYIHFRGYTDASGGNDNLLMLNKNALGIRIWQQSYGSSTPYSSYKDVCWTDGTNASGNWGINVTGSSASCTGNSATATKLSSVRTFELTGDVTGSVSSDLTSGASIATSIAAGSIVNADINASAAIADTKLATISTAGKVSNSATTATNANTANAIVARDASGNFSAGTITASLNGNASTATSAVNLSTTRTNWVTNGTITAVVGQLGWKNYGNNHTIFDASQSLSPDSTAISNTDSQVAWTSTYPTLMGWNGSSTYGVRVDSSRTSDKLSSSRTFALTGDVTGSVSSDLTSGASIATSIAAGSIVDADVNASAAIAGTKISPNFGSQTITTTGTTQVGSVNIGNSVAAAELLQLYRSNGAGNVGLRVVSDGQVEYKFGISDADNRLYITNTNGGTAIGSNTNGIVIDSNGNAGVGTTPGVRLDVYTNSANSNIIRAGNTTTTVYLDANVGYSYLNTVTNHPMLFGTNNTERARFSGGGYFRASSNAAYQDATGSYFEFYQHNNNINLLLTATNSVYNTQVFYINAHRAANLAYNFVQLVSGNFGDTEFVLRGDGNGFCDGAWTGGGADYAEYFEWADGNVDDEDRRGLSVVLENEKIRVAEPGEEPFGVISGNPSVVGDSHWNKWAGKYLRDEFGTYILEEYETTDEEGSVVISERRKLNPDFDPSLEYVPRENRPEWDCVGLLGKIRVRKGQVTGSRWVKMREISADVDEWLIR